MKSIITVVLIMLIGMISLNGYSSTTTHTTKKRDIIEKQASFTTQVLVTVNQMISVENRDVGLNTSLYNNKNENVRTVLTFKKSKLANRASIYRDSFLE